MLKICSEYEVEFDVKFNSRKSHVSIVKVKDDMKVFFPEFYLSSEVLNVCIVSQVSWSFLYR